MNLRPMSSPNRQPDDSASGAMRAHVNAGISLTRLDLIQTSVTPRDNGVQTIQRIASQSLKATNLQRLITHRRERQSWPKTTSAPCAKHSTRRRATISAVF
jgi:hypothetical protein